MKIPETEEELKLILTDEVLEAMMATQVYLEKQWMGIGDHREFYNFVRIAHEFADKECVWPDSEEPTKS